MLYFDLDGVHADFNAGVLSVTGRLPEDFPKVGEMWRLLQKHPNFFGTLPQMEGAAEMWAATKHLDPTFLTGCPLGGWAQSQKRYWTATTYNWHRIITTFSSDKHTFCQPGDILVDDRNKLRARWEEAGGIFVLHTSADSTLAELRQLGVL